MSTNENVNGFGKPLDFDRVLSVAADADATETLGKTNAAIAAGDLIRRVRDRKGVSQPILSKRTDITQPHISEIERGLGQNGPTVGTLARLLSALGDELILQSKQERALWIARRIDAAESSIADITEALALSDITDMNQVLSALALANKSETENPFKNTLLNGIILGIHMTLRSLSRSSDINLTNKIFMDAAEDASQRFSETDFAKSGFSRMFRNENKN